MRFTLAVLLCALGLTAADLPRRAPGFALVDSKFRVYDLADYRGKPVILEFMQTTCPHCAEFTAALDRVQQKYGERVSIIAIANPPDDQTKVAQFTAGHKITYPILFDCGQVAYSYLLKQRFDLPEVFLIDANGIIQRQFEWGPLTRDIFQGNGLIGEIDRLLAAGGSRKK
jgi:peroxiredoxin